MYVVIIPYVVDTEEMVVGGSPVELEFKVIGAEIATVVGPDET